MKEGYFFVCQILPITFLKWLDSVCLDEVFGAKIPIQFVNDWCFAGSPPLWLTKMGSDCFVGGAKIIMRNLQTQSNLGRKQRLHIIDHVLEPLTPVNSDNSQGYIDLTAGKLLRESETYKIPKHTIR